MDYIELIVAGIFVNNILLAQFLGNCPFLGDCVFMGLWDRAQRAMDSVYDQTTIQALIDQEIERTGKK